MALLENQLVVKTSTLPGAGKGLFTTEFIPKGSRIIEYKGRITTWKDVVNGKVFNGYVYYINRNHVVDAMKRLKSLGRYANDARGLTRVKGINNNTIYVVEKKKVYMEAIKDIPAGGEIFVSYGKEYWDVIRENLKIQAASEKSES
jgi:uncharacterized protein